MSLSMSDFIDYYFHYSDREDSAYIDKLIFHSTLGKMRFIAALVALCQLTAFIASFLSQYFSVSGKRVSQNLLPQAFTF